MGEEKREKRIRERIFKSGFDPDLVNQELFSVDYDCSFHFLTYDLIQIINFDSFLLHSVPTS